MSNDNTAEMLRKKYDRCVQTLVSTPSILRIIVQSAFKEFAAMPLVELEKERDHEIRFLAKLGDETRTLRCRLGDIPGGEEVLPDSTIRIFCLLESEEEDDIPLRQRDIWILMYQDQTHRAGSGKFTEDRWNSDFAFAELSIAKEIPDLTEGFHAHVLLYLLLDQTLGLCERRKLLKEDFPMIPEEEYIGEMTEAFSLAFEIERNAFTKGIKEGEEQMLKHLVGRMQSAGIDAEVIKEISGIKPEL